MTDDQLHDKIERYLLGQLPPQEAADFEAAAAADPALREQVEIQRIASLGYERLAEQDLQAKFARWDAELDTPSQPTQPAFNPKLLLPLLAGLLAVGAFFYFKGTEKPPAPPTPELARRDSLIAALNADFQQVKRQLDSLSAEKTDSLQQLQIRRLREELQRKDEVIRHLERRQSPSGASQRIAQNAAPPASQFIESARSRGRSDADPVLPAALKAIENQSFTEAERLLLSIPTTDPRWAQVVRWMPYVLFYQAKYEAAIPAFLELRVTDRFDMTADWHLLLCYTTDLDRHGAEARFLLRGILSNPSHKHFEDARRLETSLRAAGLL